MYKDPHRYDDMLELPRPISGRHPRMSDMNRAAQFAPFSALTGYEDQVAESARLTDHRIELTEEKLSLLDRKLQDLQTQIDSHPRVRITYFLPDSLKEGGAYLTVFGIVKKLDFYRKTVMLYEESRPAELIQIPLHAILDLDFCTE